MPNVNWYSIKLGQKYDRKLVHRVNYSLWELLQTRNRLE